MDKLVVDLAICTFGRADTVLKVLERSKVELGFFNRVLVIDNNPGGLPAAACESLRALSVEIHHEPAMGLSRARNRALAESKANFVWFIDDDASLVSGFSEKAAAFFARLDLLGRESWPVFGGGFILAASEECRLDDIGSFELGLLSCMNPAHAFSQPWGANMFVNRRVALEVGGFDPQLGWVKESGALLGEEDDLYLRMQKQASSAQGRIAFAEGCEVHHWIPLWRRKLSWLGKRAFKGGRSNYLVYRSYSNRELFEALKSLLKGRSKDNLLRLIFVVGKLYQHLISERSPVAQAVAS